MKSTDRAIYRKLGFCPRCGQAEIYGDERACPECRAKETIATAKWRAKNKEHYNQVHKEWAKNSYYECKAKGICVVCRKRKASEGKTRCSICTAKENERRRIREGEKIPRTERYLHGLCALCDSPPMEGYKLCEKHYQTSIKAAEKGRQKQKVRESE